MDKHRCLKVASRINHRLQSELGEGVDAQRMLTEPLYARDVLLVCDALVGTDLQALAGSFRKAMAKTAHSPLMRAPLGIASLLNAIFGPAKRPAPPTPTPKPAPPAASARLTRQPGAATRRLQPPDRPRRTAVRPPHRRAAR